MPITGGPPTWRAEMEQGTQTKALAVVSNTLPVVSVPGTDLVETPRSSLERRIQLNKTAILEAMTNAGVKSATAEYTGEGDSGNGIDVSVEGGFQLAMDIQVHIAVATSKWDQTERRWETVASTKTTSLAEALEQMVDDLIALHHSGFENNDGGGGEITFDAQAQSVSYEYFDYYVERESHSVDV